MRKLHSISFFQGTKLIHFNWHHVCDFGGEMMGEVWKKEKKNM